MNKKLNELLNIKKKGEASIEKKKNFTELLSKEFSKQGINENTVTMLDKGFSFEGAKAIVLYINTLPNKEKMNAINSLFKTKTFKNNNKGIAFKFLISILAELMPAFDLDNKEIIRTIVLKIPKNIKNKEGKEFGDINLAIKKYFIQILNPKTKIPNFKQLNIDNEVISQFEKIFTKAVSEIKNPTKSEKQVIEYVLKSLNTKAEPDTKITEKKKQSEINNKKKNKKTVLHKKNENQTIKKDKVDNHKITELENKVKELQSIIEKSKDENKIISNELHNISKELEESKKYNAELIHKCNTLQNDLKKHMNILNIFEKNAQNSQKELLNSIASKLKCEYIDFKSAKNMPMTVDLGENLRVQINTIFQLLEKNGISVKEKERSKEKEIVKK